MPADPAALLALQMCAGNTAVTGALQRHLSVQRSNPADPRLPRDQPEALSYATTSHGAIIAALVGLGASAVSARRNAPALVSQLALFVEPLTPRHDSPVGSASITFFAGNAGYGTSIALSATVDHQVDTAARRVRVRARDHGNVDTPLTSAQVEDRVFSGVSVLAQNAGGPAVTSIYDQYRAEFNAVWDVAPYTALSTAFDPALDSRGPRNARARAIFDKVLADNPLLLAVYQGNLQGARAQLDRYSAPDGWNLLNSPNIAAVRSVFSASPSPVPDPSYAGFRSALLVAAARLTPDEQRAIAASNDWEQTINASVLTEARRQDVRAAIATTAPAPAPGPLPPAPPPAPGPAMPGAGAPRRFVDGIHIDAPTAPVLGNAREELIPLTPKSTVPNPGVTLSTSFTLTPAARVRGANTSPPAAWPAANQSGVSFSPPVTTTGAAAMTAHLDVTGLPAGLTRSTPVPDANFVVQDNRQANLVAVWTPEVLFNDGSRQTFLSPSSAVRYRGGTQTFSVGAALPAGQTNPGLTVFVRSTIKRGATVVVPPPPITQFPADQERIPRFNLQVPAPAVVPPAGDPLSIEVELLAADRATVLSTRTVPVAVLPEATYTQAAAEAAALADDVHFHDNSASGLLGQMTARGGVAANVAIAINSGQLRLRPLTVRHDSAAFVAARTGAPNPALVGYFYGPVYRPPGVPDPNSSANVAGAAGFTLGAGSGEIVMNRTTDVATNAKRSDAEIIMLTIHEGVHAMDLPHANRPIEKYRTEFRAYWMDGRFGAPDHAVRTPADPPEFLNATPDPSMTPPGPKSPRARAIFNVMYGSVTYPWAKPAYDNNTDGFRDEVDNTSVPDGINLILSGPIAELRHLFEAGGNEALLHIRVRSFMGIGPPPPAPGAVLTPDERRQIAGNRAWRDLVVRTITNAGIQAAILADLGIRT